MAKDKSDQTAVFRHLSGSHRGKVTTLEGKTLFILREPNGEITITAPDGHPVSHNIATLHQHGSSYELVVGKSLPVWANGIRVAENHLLQSGDLIELGQPGPVLRFRLYQSDVIPKKSLAEALADSMDVAKVDSHSGLGVTGYFIKRLSTDLATQTTLWFRIWTLLVLSLLIVATIALVIQNYRFQKQLSSESVRIESIANRLKQTGAAAMTSDEFSEVRKEIEQQLSQTAERVASLEARSGTIAKVISSSTQSIAFVQGIYGYSEKTTARPLRFVQSPEGVYLFTFDQIGEIVSIPFSGTAFVASNEGLLLTNKHIVEPWVMSDAINPPESIEIEPAILKIRAFFPGQEKPVALAPLNTAKLSDLAVLRPDNSTSAMNHLDLEVKPPVPGDSVVVLGYPFGLSGILARADPEFVATVRDTEQLGFWELGAKLARHGYIKPLASRGIVSQLTKNFIAYDAETTTGGSGGPVLNLEGRVVAVNTATMGKHGGSNLGIPATHIAELLKQVEYTE